MPTITELNRAAFALKTGNPLSLDIRDIIGSAFDNADDTNPEFTEEERNDFALRSLCIALCDGNDGRWGTPYKQIADWFRAAGLVW